MNLQYKQPNFVYIKSRLDNSLIEMILSSWIYFQEEESPKYSEVQKNILQKEEQHKFKEIKSQTNISLPGISENDKFTKKLQAARSVNELLDLAMLPNLSIPNALKLISRIMNEINSGKSRFLNIETDQRFIHLRKMVKTKIDTRTDTRFCDDLSQYSQLSTPAMISVGIMIIC